MKTTIPLFLTVLCLSVAGPKAQAVNPPPDGNYPGGNTAEGLNALFSLATGTYNTAIGYFSLEGVTTGSFNTGVGAGALFANTGNENTATGAGALLNNTTGSENTANGESALFFNTAGTQNTAIGSSALLRNTLGYANTSSGFEALSSNTQGAYNTAGGFQALSANTDGLGNTALGANALSTNTTGSFNTAIGFGAGQGIIGVDNVICIGAAGLSVNNSCFIGNIRGVTTDTNDAVPVLIDSAGQLGTVSSSRRYKTEIKPIEEASESILALKPVSFHYKVHKDTKPQFGLIAEDVAKVNPDLVIYDADGKPYTVRYDAVNAMLLNEFLKAHRKVQQLEANDAEQQREIKALAAIVKEQATQIQKVSAQLATASPSLADLN